MLTLSARSDLKWLIPIAGTSAVLLILQQCKLNGRTITIQDKGTIGLQTTVTSLLTNPYSVKLHRGIQSKNEKGGHKGIFCHPRLIYEKLTWNLLKKIFTEQSTSTLAERCVYKYLEHLLFIVRHCVCLTHRMTGKALFNTANLAVLYTGVVL